MLSALAWFFLSVIGLPPMRKRSASRFCPRTRLFTDPFSRLQLFLYVQASAFASLPGRSYRGKFPCRAAEAFTSELNVHRCLCTHRIYYPPDNRQLAERGLTPRKIHSIVDCSSHFWGSLQRNLQPAEVTWAFQRRFHAGDNVTKDSGDCTARLNFRTVEMNWEKRQKLREDLS